MPGDHWLSQVHLSLVLAHTHLCGDEAGPRNGGCLTVAVCRLLFRNCVFAHVHAWGCSGSADGVDKLPPSISYRSVTPLQGHFL